LLVLLFPHAVFAESWKHRRLSGVMTNAQQNKRRKLPRTRPQ